MRLRRALIAVTAVLAALAVVIAFIAAVPPRAYDGEPAFVVTPVDHVDTLIGTGTGGETVGEINNFPGAAVPFGMVQYSPDTVGNYAGYNYDNPRSTGFSMTHASVGCAAFGDISMLPTTTPIGSQPWNAWERIAHDDTEVGVPGYYTVRFPATEVTAELTATTRTGIGRFRYPRNGRPALFHVRSGASLAGNSRATIQIGEDNTTITGWATSGGFCGKSNTYTVYFAMKFSQPFASYGTWDGYAVHPGVRGAASPYSGGYVEFPPGSEVEVRTAISYVGVDGARANLAAEGTTPFDAVRAAASSQWNAALSRISVAGRDGDDVQTFYTFAVPIAVAPQHLQRRRRPLHRIRQRHPHRCRRPHPVHQLLRLGHLPMPCRLAGAALPEASQRHGPVAGQRCGAKRIVAALGAGECRDRHDDRGQRGTPHREPLRLRGQGLRRQNGAALHGERGDHGRCRAQRLRRKAWRRRLSGVGLRTRARRPQRLDHAESGPLTTSPSPIRGLARRRGDRRRIPEPGAVLAAPVQSHHALRLAAQPARILPRRSGVRGLPNSLRPVRIRRGQRRAIRLVGAAQHRRPGDRPRRPHGSGRPARPLHQEAQRGPQPALWAGNEPDFGVPWLYNYIGQPWKTQHTVNRVRGLFGPFADGEPGNDDLGALSSWYVWAALGLYPSTPGTSILTVGTPFFDRAVIALPGGRSIRISAPGASAPSR